MEPINVLDYEPLAKERIDPVHWDYYAGGSEDEITLQANRSDLTRLRLRPRMLVDVGQCDTSTTVLGTPISLPVMIAPTAFHSLAHANGECATAQGAGAARTLMTVSTGATRTLEEVASVATGPLWFQLYLYPTREIAAMLVKRAEDAGYRAIVLTIDMPTSSKRERDLRNKAEIPAPRANFVGIDTEYRLAVNLTWADVDWLCSITSLPVLVKGLLTAEDAALALQHGVSGIVVSNHGGRQLDTAISTIEALPEVIAEVAGHCEVYVDGGFRRGTDVIKALALGARAVLIGRPVLWGLAVNGAQGVQHILEILREELETSMKLCGCPSIKDIQPSLVKFPA